MKSTDLSIALIARSAAHEPLLAAGARAIGSGRHDTPFGRSNPIHIMEAEGLRFCLLSRHGEEGYQTAAPWVNDRANLFALKELGVERIVSWSSPGSLERGVNAGDLVIPDDVLDETGSTVRSFFEGMGIGVIRMSDPFCPALRAAFSSALKTTGIPVHDGGVYAGTHGPRLETAAEVRKLRTLGGTVVGMTVVPEVFLARELEMCYASVCLVVNQAEGLRAAAYEPGVLFEGLASAKDLESVSAVEKRFGDHALALLKSAAADTTGGCHCRRALERYRARGDIGRDWRRWWD